MIELTVCIEEKEGEVWCTASTCVCKSATDYESTVLKEDFLPLLDNDEHTIDVIKGLNLTRRDDSQLEFDFDSGDDIFDDEEFDFELGDDIFNDEELDFESGDDIFNDGGFVVYPDDWGDSFS